MVSREDGAKPGRACCRRRCGHPYGPALNRCCSPKSALAPCVVSHQPEVDELTRVHSCACGAGAFVVVATLSGSPARTSGEILPVFARLSRLSPIARRAQLVVRGASAARLGYPFAQRSGASSSCHVRVPYCSAPRRCLVAHLSACSSVGMHITSPPCAGFPCPLTMPSVGVLVSL